MSFKLETFTDENLKTYARDPIFVQRHVESLLQYLNSSKDPAQEASTLGEAGYYLKVLGNLDKAEELLQKALKIIENHQLGIKKEIQQKIRLGHVLQWKKEFSKSNSLFAEVLQTCRNNSDLEVYLDFALQHSGKNLFDQARYMEAELLFKEALELRRKRKAPQDQIESTEYALKRTIEEAFRAG